MFRGIRYFSFRLLADICRALITDDLLVILLDVIAVDIVSVDPVHPAYLHRREDVDILAVPENTHDELTAFDVFLDQHILPVKANIPGHQFFELLPVRHDCSVGNALAGPFRVGLYDQRIMESPARASVILSAANDTVLRRPDSI